MEYKQLVWSGHVIKQMFQRNITRAEVKSVIEDGDIIISYHDDKPYPSVLLFKILGSRPLHVVAARNEKDNSVYIITAYEPSPEIWNEDFRTRKER